MMTKDISFHAVNAGNLKAMVTLTYGDLQINGFKVLDSKDGLWVGMPSRAFKRRDGQEAYAPIVWIEDEGVRRAFQREILEAWNKGEAKEEAKEEAPATPVRAGRGS